MSITGTFVESRPRRLALDLDPPSIEAAMCELIAELLGPDACEVSVETDRGSVKIPRQRAAIRLRSGLDLTLSFGDEQRTLGVKLSFTGKSTR